MRRRRMRRNDVEDLLAVVHAAARLDLVAEDDLLAGVVQRRHEAELSAPRIDRPAGKGARDVDHVLLRVTGVDAERVELEELAAVVLVEAARLLLAGFGLRVGR